MDVAMLSPALDAQSCDMDICCSQPLSLPQTYQPAKPVISFVDWPQPPVLSASLVDAVFTSDARCLTGEYGWPDALAHHFDDDDDYTDHWPCQRVDPLTHKCSLSLSAGVKLKLCGAAGTVVRVAASSRPWHLVATNCRFDVGDPELFDGLCVALPNQRVPFELALDTDAQYRKRILNLATLPGRDVWAHLSSRSEVVFELSGDGGLFLLTTSGRVDAHVDRGFVELWSPPLCSPMLMPFRYCVVNTPTLYSLSCVLENRYPVNPLDTDATRASLETRYRSIRSGFSNDMERFWLLRQLRAQGTETDAVPRFYLGGQQIMVRRDSEDDVASAWTLFHGNRALCQLHIATGVNNLYFTLLYDEEAYAGNLLDYYVYQ